MMRPNTHLTIPSSTVAVIHLLDVDVYVLLTHCTTVLRYKSGPFTSAHVDIRVKGRSLAMVTGYYCRDIAFPINLPTSLGIILLIKCLSLSQQS